MRKHSMGEMANGFFILLGNIICLISIPVFLLGLLALVSPDMYYNIMCSLPSDIQFFMSPELIMSTFRPWAYMVGAGVLWFVGHYIKE